MNRISHTKREVFIFFLAFVFAAILYKMFNFHYAFNNDTWNYHYTTCTIIKEQLQAGIFPSWNNYEALGMPLIDKGAIDLFSIPLLYFLPVKSYLVFVGFLYLLMAIYFMYRYLVSEGIKPYIALSAGVIWATNGYFLWHLHEFSISAGCAFIPLVFLTVKHMADDVKPLCNWLYFVLLNSIQLSYGKWDLYEYGLWSVFLYIFIVVNKETPAGGFGLKKKLKLTGFVLLGVVAAFFLIAPFTIPYVKTILSAYRVGPESSASISTVDYYKFQYVLQHLFPNTGRYDSRSFTSLFVFPFVLLAVFQGRMKRINLFALTLICLYFVLAYPFNIYELVRMLPLHEGNINIIRVNTLFYLGLSIAFAFGLQDFLARDNKSYRTILAVFMTAVVCLTVWYARVHYLRIDNYLSMVFFLIPLLALIVIKVMRAPSELLSKIFVSYIIMYTLVFSFLFNKHDRNDGNLAQLEMQVEAESRTALVVKLRSLAAINTPSVWRVVDDRLFHPSFLPRNLIETINFYGQFPSKDVCEVAIKIFGNDFCYNSIYKYNVSDSPQARLFSSLASVKYFVISKSECREGLFQKNILYSDDKLCIIENTDAFDRIRFADNYRIVVKSESIDFIRAENIEWFKKQFIIDGDPGLSRARQTSGGVQYAILDSRPNLLKVEVSSPHDTIMIVSNAYSENWKVRVNDKPEILYRVNGFFQGVKIKPGKNTYTLSYSRGIF